MPHSYLIEKMQEIQKILQSEEVIERKRLEQLAEEAMASFDFAIKEVDQRIDVREEIRLRKEAMKKWRLGFFRSFLKLSLKHILAIPFIYAIIVPAVILHLFIELYQQVCFRLFDIPRVKARDYFIFDRALLPYLNWLEKINCVYCSYVNNLFQFAAEIGGRTERYWCPIKYANRVKKTHSQYDRFTEFLEAETFRKKWNQLKDFSDLKEEKKNKPD